jgi:outer membrane protein assembly factor BamB
MSEDASNQAEQADRGPYLVQVTPDFDPAAELELARVDNPLPNTTLGDIGLAARVDGPERFPPSLLVQPFERLAGIDPASVRMFRLDEASGTLRPVWDSGVNTGLGFVWTMLRRPGTLVPVGLPHDKVLLELLRSLARQRWYDDTAPTEEQQELTRQALALFLEPPLEAVQELRQALTLLEQQTSGQPIPEAEIQRGGGAGILPLPLPGDATPEQFRERLARLEVPPSGLPEEALFFSPERFIDPEPPWTLPPRPVPPPWPGPDLPFTKLPIFDLNGRLRLLFPFLFCWLFSKDWWMYHHDDRHSGAASGCSAISRFSVGGLLLRSSLTLNGPVISIPTVVGGKVYVGTGKSSAAAFGSGGTVYKIDLYSGAVDATFTFDTPPGAGSRQGYEGIGSSPAVVGGRVYVSGLDGKLYCLDTTTLSPVWVTDLRHDDSAHNQPVTHAVNAEGWSSPLVVNGKVYVGFGEGESNTFGYVYCLDAATGNVLWLFCTNLFAGVTDNTPNVIPASQVGISPLPPGFSSQPDPPQRGASPWSSCAYDRALDRVYVGTGNAIPDDPLPDPKYSSGVLALDAGTGAFAGFFQPAPSDSYRPDDLDVDVPAGPTIFRRGATTVLFIASKNGSGFLLDPATMAVLPNGRRQLLPTDAAGNLLPNVDRHTFSNENFSGVLGTAAVHRGLRRIFVGVGGYSGAIDTPTTPFMRALDWNDLSDAWTTAVGPDGVARYTVPRPPMYTTPNEAGLSSPAVVNDVVFVSTSKPALYALDAATGLCLWVAPGLGSPSPATYTLGPAIYGNSVVVGSLNGNLNIYSL